MEAVGDASSGATLKDQDCAERVALWTGFPFPAQARQSA
jgi:hypothetical protein